MVKIEIRMRLSSIKYYQYIILLYSNVFVSLLWPSCQFVKVRPPFLYYGYFTTIVKNNILTFQLVNTKICSTTIPRLYGLPTRTRRGQLG